MVNVSFLVAINKEIKGLLRFYSGNLKKTSTVDGFPC